MQPEKRITDAEKKAYKENEADFRRLDEQIREVRMAASSRLVAAGRDFNPDAQYCYRCWCEQYEGNGGPCVCRHGFSNHANVI